MIASLQEGYDTPRQCVEKQRHHFADECAYSQSYDLSSSPVLMWELDRKEGRAPKNWCLWSVVLEKTLESPLDSKEIKLVNLKGNQPWILIGRTDAEAPIFWSPDVNSQLIGKNSDAGKDWKQKKRASEAEMAGWHHQWTWTWANFRRWWGTGQPALLQSMGLQRAGPNRVTEEQQYSFDWMIFVFLPSRSLMYSAVSLVCSWFFLVCFSP